MKTKCTRCGRALNQVYMHAGRPFGSTCVKLYAQDSGIVVRIRDAVEYTGQADWIGTITDAQHDSSEIK